MSNPIKPDVSVIVPIYNIEQFLPDCLNSLLAQHGLIYEIICIDDGSNDSSGHIAENYAAKHPEIKVIHTSNSGLSVARNTGMHHANGKYIFFIDGDDQITSNALNELFQSAEVNNVDVIFFNAETMYESIDLQIKHNSSKHAGERNKKYDGIGAGANLGIEQIKNEDYTPAVPLGLYQKSFIDSLKLEFIPGIIHEDNIFSFHIYINAKKCVHISENYYKRLIRQGSITNSLSDAKSFIGYAVTHFEVLHAQHNVSNAEQAEFSKLIATNVYVHCMKILEEPDNISACWPLVKQWHHLGQRLHMEALLYSAEHIASARSLGMQSATEGLMPKRTASGRAMVPTFGFIDAINHESCKVGARLYTVVEGWLLLWGCEVPDTLTLSSGSQNATLTQLNWHPREDVKVHHAQAKLQCGFKAVFKFDSTPTDQFRLVGLLGSCAESEPLFFSSK
jgi:glycosyltransferase involved in cell wall biosynthesis